MKVIPQTKTPGLALDTVKHGRFDLSEQKPASFTMLVFYRGHHCPLCMKQLQELERMLPEFQENGIDVIAISTNSKELAERSADEWEIENLPIAYGLPIEQATRWGLFISNAVKESEPAQFSEPGIFFVRPDGTLYASMIQTMPFARPPARRLLGFLTWVAENDYPARGEAESVTAS